MFSRSQGTDLTNSFKLRNSQYSGGTPVFGSTISGLGAVACSPSIPASSKCFFYTLSTANAQTRDLVSKQQARVSSDAGDGTLPSASNHGFVLRARRFVRLFGWQPDHSPNPHPMVQTTSVFSNVPDGGRIFVYGQAVCIGRKFKMSSSNRKDKIRFGKEDIVALRSWSILTQWQTLKIEVQETNPKCTYRRGRNLFWSSPLQTTMHTETNLQNELEPNQSHKGAKKKRLPLLSNDG